MQYYSPGKLLITGEYLVLNGATALAVPVKYGQWLDVDESEGDDVIYWESFENDNVWFSAEFNSADFKVVNTSDINISHRLSKLLQSIRFLKPETFREKITFRFNTRLEFNITWGLGSSSTLISNLASWAGVDPYALMALYSKGSGYDIACARSQGPLLYTRRPGKLPEIENIVFNPVFRDHIFFVYSGRKQLSEQSVIQYLDTIEPDAALVDRISSLGRSLIKVKTLQEFNNIISQHEQLISSILGKEKIKTLMFPDFPGEVKSLGAWGGDFIMASSPETKDIVKQYFTTKGLTELFTFKEMVKC